MPDDVFVEGEERPIKPVKKKKRKAAADSGEVSSINMITVLLEPSKLLVRGMSNSKNSRPTKSRRVLSLKKAMMKRSQLVLRPQLLRKSYHQIVSRILALRSGMQCNLR